MNPSDLHDAPPLLDARGLCFSRNEQPVFGPLDITVGAGEALLVHGDNGSGKSTLLRVLAGLLPAGAGEISIDGQSADRDAVARSAHLLGHQLGFKGELGCMHNLRFAMALFGRRRGASPNAALESVGLDGYQDSEARQLSAGQRKRLGLARLLLVPARLWLLDEPYANLDLEGITLVNRLVERHLGSGGSALITSHGAYATPAVRSRVLELSPLSGAGAAA